MADPAAGHAGALPSANELALDRTRLAHERTMMAWIRTAVSLISFGFTIYKFLDSFKSGSAAVQGALAPRTFALCMIGIGLFVLAGSVVQNWWELRRLRMAARVPRSLAGIVALLVFLLGIVALTAVILRQ